MNILRRFINQVFTPQEVEATPENVAKWEKERPDGPSAATAAAWRNPSGNTASFTNRQAGKGTLAAVPAAANGRGSSFPEKRRETTPYSSSSDSKNPSTNHSFL
ncbi:hypothetical protein ABFY27_11835 [Akkermansia massiliensis]